MPSETDRKLIEIKTEAAKLRRFAAIEKKIGLEHKSGGILEAW